MSINPSPRTLDKFQAYREVLSKIKNNGNTNALLSHDEVMLFFMSNSPIDKDVEDFMKDKENNANKFVNIMKGKLNGEPS